MLGSIAGFLPHLVGIVAILLLGAVSLYSLFIIHQRRKYAHLPVPEPVNFFLGHVSAIKKAKDEEGNMFMLLGRWAQKYGNTFVLFFAHEPVVFTCKPESVQALMVNEHFPKSRRYSLVAWTFGQRTLGNGLVTDLDHERWRVRRLGLNHAFHRVVLKKLTSEFNSASDELIKVLGSHAEKKDDVKLAPLLALTALDVIGKVAYGKDLNSLQGTDAGSFKVLFGDLFRIMDKNIEDPTLSWPLRGLKYKREIKGIMQTLQKTAIEWMSDRVEASKRGDYIPDDILTHMMRLRETTDVMTDDIMIDDFITFFVAGLETTSNALSFMILETAKHPEMLRRLREEVDEVIGQKSHVSFEDLSKLEYMTLCWKETLRMFPIATVSFRDIDRDDYKVDGYVVPRDTAVMMSSFVSSRNPNLVNDPETFKPERFALDSEEKPNTYAYFPFALGPRNCIGQNFAQFEAKTIFAKILQNFDYELDQNQPMEILETTTLRPKGGVKIKISFRKNDQN